MLKGINPILSPDLLHGLRSIGHGDENAQLCQRHAATFKVTPLYGDAFYQHVKSAHTIVATSEPRPYANMFIRKGVIYP